MTRFLRGLASVLIILATVFACDAAMGRHPNDGTGAEAVWRREAGR